MFFGSARRNPQEQRRHGLALSVAARIRLRFEMRRGQARSRALSLGLSNAHFRSLGTPLREICGRCQYLRPQRTGGSAGDGEHQTIHHTKAEAQSENEAKSALARPQERIPTRSPPQSAAEDRELGSPPAPSAPACGISGTTQENLGVVLRVAAQSISSHNATSSTLRFA